VSTLVVIVYEQTVYQQQQHKYAERHQPRVSKQEQCQTHAKEKNEMLYVIIVIHDVQRYNFLLDNW